MIIAVWIVSGLLALMYLVAGITKTFSPLEKLATQMKWTSITGQVGTRAIGILEILGAIGLVVPHLTNIAPWLSVVAAFALALIQVLAIPVHFRIHDLKSLPFNVVLLLASLFVGIGLLVVL